MLPEKYTKQYIVKSYEADCNGCLRIVTLMNWLQDIAVENAEILGFGFDICHSRNLAWVGSNYFLQITRLPTLDEHITIETWPAEAKLWGAIRDFLIKDAAGNVIIRAASQWVLIDYDKRRPVPLQKYFPEYTCRAERAIEIDFAKMNAPTEISAVYEHNVRFDDIDINRHVNNAVYVLWASESVDKEFRLTHTPQEIEICFKKEALYGESVLIATYQQQNNSYHTINDKNSGEKLAECRITWQEITSK